VAKYCLLEEKDSDSTKKKSDDFLSGPKDVAFCMYIDQVTTYFLKYDIMILAKFRE
jgi:hypothetical protein